VRLSDIMSAMQLATYAEVGLVLFMAAFLAIGVNLFRRGNAGFWERARHLPLEPEHPPISARPTRDVPTLTSRR
jgi:hypothetical protein